MEGEKVDRMMAKDGCTKGGGGSNAHYQNMYAELTAPYRKMHGIKICEIGVDTGGSMNFWLSLFPYAAGVDGLRYGRTDNDLIPCKTGGAPADCHKLKIVDADQSRSSGLRNFILKTLGSEDYPKSLGDEEGWSKTGWDIVVDDGSHVPVHMLLTFKLLWPYVRPGGMYVIEDNGFSYTDVPTRIYGYDINKGGIGKPSPGNLIEKFKQVADLVLRPWTHPRTEYTVFTPEIDATIYSVQFIAGCVVVKKKTPQQFFIAEAVVPVSSRSTGGKFGGAYSAWKQMLDAENKDWDADHVA